MKKWIFVVSFLTLASSAFAQGNQKPQAYSNCFQETPGYGGQICLAVGLASGWFNFQGDVDNLFNSVLCSATNPTACGYLSVVALHFGGGYPNGTQILLSGTPPANGQALCNNNGMIGGCNVGAIVNNAVLYAANYSGATWAEKVNAAVAALPSIGGEVDAGGLCSSAPLTAADTNVVLGSDTKPVKLDLGSCTFPLGAHQIQYFTNTNLGGNSSDATTSPEGTVISSTGANTAIAYGGSGQPVNVTFHDFRVAGDGTSGGIGIDWTITAVSSITNVTTRGFDIGFQIGGTGTCACYNDFYHFDSYSVSYGAKFLSTANSNYWYGHVIWGATGVYLNGGGNNTIFADVEGSTTAFDIFSSGNSLYSPYLEANTNPIVIESGADSNTILGASGADGVVVDHSGNTTNFYMLTGLSGTDGAWPQTFSIQSTLYFGNAITGDVNDWISVAGPANQTTGISAQYLGVNVSSYGLYGHAALTVGGVKAYAGVENQGAYQQTLITTSTAPVASVVGTTGSTTYGPFKVWCHDRVGSDNSSDTIGATLPSTGSNTITTGNATLTSSNYIHITWPVVDGCVNWDIYDSNQSACYATFYRFLSISGTTATYNVQSNSTTACTPPTANTTADTQTAGKILSTTAASISGGGSLATGSNSFAGGITGLAATSNILTPGFTCPNDVVCSFQDNTTAGGVKVTARNTTTVTFSATASDAADYTCGCR